jgi:ribosome biogenesis GTPase
LAKGKKQKQKHRVAFRKNREKRARPQNLTRQVDAAQENEEEAGRLEDLPTGERLSGKGSISRNRTVMVESVDGDSGEIRIEIDESICERGRVVTATGLNCVVQNDDGKRFDCTVRRVVRTMSREARNAVVAGDWVAFHRLDDRFGVIERVDPRRGTLSRGSKRHEHIIVSNVDQVVIVASAGEPPLKPSLIDRFLITAEKGETKALICINKADLVDQTELQQVLGLYGRLGYQTILTSATSDAGIDRLRSFLKDRESVFAGQSGVGKSSLLNAIQPGLSLDTAHVSMWSQKGRHTTRRAELIPLDFGGWVVDTPGIRQLELWDVIAEEVEGFFIEFHPFVTFCRFPDCSHTHENGCRVKQAVAARLVTESRYASYLRIMFGQEEKEL